MTQRITYIFILQVNTCCKSWQYESFLFGTHRIILFELKRMYLDDRIQYQIVLVLLEYHKNHNIYKVFLFLPSDFLHLHCNHQSFHQILCYYLGLVSSKFREKKYMIKQRRTTEIHFKLESNAVMTACPAPTYFILSSFDSAVAFSKHFIYTIHCKKWFPSPKAIPKLP